MGEQLVAVAQVELEQVVTAFAVFVDAFAPVADLLPRRLALLALALAFSTAGAAIR